MTDVTMNPRTNEGATAKENLQSNMLRQAQMQRYRKLQQRDAQLRQEAIERSRRLQDKYIVNTVYIIPGGGLSQKTESKSNKELGASAEGEVKAPDDLMIGLSSGLSILHKGESIDFERTGNLLSNYENYIISEENRKIKEEISFLNAQRAAFHFNNNFINMSSRFGSLPFYSEPKELTQAERDNLVLKAQDKSATVAERRAAMSALSGTLEGKYETSWIGERASAEAIQADSDKFVVRTQDKTATVEQRRAAMSILSETAMATEPYEGKYETTRSGQIAYEMSNAKIQERLKSDLYTDSISKVPKGKELDLSQEVFAKEKQITDRVFGDDWTSAGGKSETSYQNVKGTEKSDVADQYVLLTEGGKRLTLDVLDGGGYLIYDWHGDIVGKGRSVGERNKALKKDFIDLGVIFNEKALDPLSVEGSGRVILEEGKMKSVPDFLTPAMLKSNVLDTFWTKKDIEGFSLESNVKENTELPLKINKIGSEQIQTTIGDSDYLKKLKSEGTLWKAAEKKGFSDISVAIVGGTEIIQQAGYNFLDEQQAKVNSFIENSFIAPENKAILMHGTEFTKHFVSFPLMFQSFALGAPATEDILRSKEINDVVNVPFVKPSDEKWTDRAQVALPLAAEGLVDYAYQNPVGFSGDIAGIALGPKMVKISGLEVGRGTGIVRSKTFIAKNPTGHPLGSQSAMLESIIEQPTISGARGTIQTPKQFLNRFVDNEIQWTRPYKEGGGTFGEQAQYTTISPKYEGTVIQERVGNYFIQKGVKTPIDKIFRTRVHIVENVETVASELSPAEKQGIWKHWEKYGEISDKDYKMLVERTVAKSERIHQPVVGPTPKLRSGSAKPELEAMLFFGDAISRKITSSKFAGFTEDGTIIRKVRFGEQAPVETSSVLAENRRYNMRLTQHRIEAMSVDMNRKIAELSGSARTKPDQYYPHGKEHLNAVAEEIDVLRAKSDIYRQSFTKKEGDVAAFLHDSAKIYGTESEPFDHAVATQLAIKRGLIKYDPLTEMGSESQMKIANAIGQHSRIKPNVVSKVLHRPTKFDEALASADRLSWAKADGRVKAGKLFSIPESRLTNLALVEFKRMFNSKGSSGSKMISGQPVGGTKNYQTNPFDKTIPDTTKVDVTFPKMSTERTKWPEQHSVITPKKEGDVFNPIENMKTKPSQKPNSGLKIEGEYLGKQTKYKTPTSIYRPVTSYKQSPIYKLKSESYKQPESNYKPLTKSYKQPESNYKLDSKAYEPKDKPYKMPESNYKPKTKPYEPKNKSYKMPESNYKPVANLFEMTNTRLNKNKNQRKRKGADLDLFKMENVEIPIIRGEEALGGKYNPLERPANRKTYAKLGSDVFQISKKTGNKLKRQTARKKKDMGFSF